jgi:hypothetical protein
MQTENTSVVSSLLSAPSHAISNMFMHPVSDPSALQPANIIGSLVVIAVIFLLLGKLFIIKR